MRNTKKIRLVLTRCLPALISVVGGCVTGEAPMREEGAIKISDSSGHTDFSPIVAKNFTGEADYKFKDQPAKAHWMACQTSGSTGTVAVMHRDEAGYDDVRFCESWIAQAFLRNKFDVIAVNRPGYVKSTGPYDFAGARSLAAIEAGIAAGTKQLMPSRPIVGLYGYEGGAIAATFAAKKINTAKWIILGNGYYDLEVIAKDTTSSFVKGEIASVIKSEGKVALENRSIAYDPAGLPKRIAMYHGRENKTAPVNQALTFRDTLASSEYVVTIDALDSITHELSPAHHRQIVEVLAKAVQITVKK